MVGDYISREAAMTVLDWDCASQDALNAIKAIPAADVVEVRHGRWELHDNGDGTCSRCGILQKHIWDMDGWQNFCGHCGADMWNGGKDDV